MIALYFDNKTNANLKMIYSLRGVNDPAAGLVNFYIISKSISIVSLIPSALPADATKFELIRIA